MKVSDRLLSMPPYIFSEINKMKAEATKRGIQLLSLAIGDPDQPTPDEIVDKIVQYSKNPETHVYSPYEGTLEFRQAATRWMQKRFNVSVNAETEIVALIGSKEGIGHFPLAFCNPGDKVLFPSPGYPIFQNSILLAGGIPIPISHRAENHFLPDLNELEELLKKHRPKFMILNYPSNPTSVVCDKKLLEQIIGLALKYETPIAYDNAYCEVYYEDAQKPPSILEIPGAKDIAIEFHSLSKSFNMTGWRIGFVAGNVELVQGLLKVKTNVDSGPLLSVQAASEYALDNADRIGSQIRKVYEGRRTRLLDGLEKLGLEFLKPQATFFVWTRVPGGIPSMEFTKTLIEKEGLVVTPGMGFGKEGEGFFRLALTVPNDQIDLALKRLGSYLKGRGATGAAK